MNAEIKEILDNIKEDINGKFEWEYIDGYYVEQIKPLLDYITNLQQENKRLNQNQVKVLNRIRDFIYSSKCEITEGSYCDDKHSQYWKMFKKFAEEVQDKIKGLDIEDYVYIPKWREQELLSQEEQLEDYKSRCEEAIPMLKKLNIKLKDILKTGIDIKEISDIEDTLNGRSDE